MIYISLNGRLGSRLLPKLAAFKRSPHQHASHAAVVTDINLPISNRRPFDKSYKLTAPDPLDSAPALLRSLVREPEDTVRDEEDPHDRGEHHDHEGYEAEGDVPPEHQHGSRLQPPVVGCA
mgnify:CR=1 FL=1